MNIKLVFLALLALSASSAANSAQTQTDTSQSAKVETLLKVSGISAQLGRLSDGLVAEIVGLSGRGNSASDERGEMGALARKAFQPGRFTQAAKQSLLKHYDASAYDRYIALMSDPLVVRFTDMEGLPINGEAFSSYMKELQAKPFAVDRIKLIEAIDEASRTSEFRIKIITTIAETVSIASLGACPTKERVAEIKGALSKAKDSIKQQGEASSRIALAYTYRNATEAELTSYLKTMREGAVQSVNKRVGDAALVEMKSGFVVVGDALRAMATTASKQQTVFAQRSCDGKSLLPPPGYAKSTMTQTMSTPPEPPPAPITPPAPQTKMPTTPPAAPIAAESPNREVVPTTTSAAKDVPGHKTAMPQRSQINIDARECLRHEDNKTVMACTERYR
jgi:hypothetical protein